MKRDEDLLLDRKGQKKIIRILRKYKFRDFEIHRHYWESNSQELGPRHGVSLKDTKKVFCQFKKIIAVSKRKSNIGFKYCFHYKINNRVSYKLIFLLDEDPKKLFNAIKEGSNIEKRLMRKYFGFSK